MSNYSSIDRSKNKTNVVLNFTGRRRVGQWHRSKLPLCWSVWLEDAGLGTHGDQARRNNVWYVSPAAHLRHQVEVWGMSELRSLFCLLSRRQAQPETQVLPNHHSRQWKVKPLSLWTKQWYSGQGWWSTENIVCPISVSTLIWVLFSKAIMSYFLNFRDPEALTWECHLLGVGWGRFNTGICGMARDRHWSMLRLSPQAAFLVPRNLLSTLKVQWTEVALIVFWAKMDKVKVHETCPEAPCDRSVLASTSHRSPMNVRDHQTHLYSKSDPLPRQKIYSESSNECICARCKDLASFPG